MCCFHALNCGSLLEQPRKTVRASSLTWGSLGAVGPGPGGNTPDHLTFLQVCGVHQFTSWANAWSLCESGVVPLLAVARTDAAPVPPCQGLLAHTSDGELTLTQGSPFYPGTALAGRKFSL